jgi:hypothetical protein
VDQSLVVGGHSWRGHEFHPADPTFHEQWFTAKGLVDLTMRVDIHLEPPERFGQLRCAGQWLLKQSIVDGVA